MLRVLASISCLLLVVSAQGDQVPIEKNHDSYYDRQIASLLDQMHALRVENTKVLKKVKAENTKLVGRIDSFEAENTKLVGRIDSLEAENTKLAKNTKLVTRIYSLEAENTKLVGRIDSMEAENTKLVTSMDVMKAENININLASELHAMKVDNMKLLDKMNTIESKLDVPISEKTDMKPELIPGADSMDTFISFTAFATEDRYYNDGDKVLFDGIVRNYGGYYNASESQFVCPATAYYLFSVTVRSMSNYPLHGSIYLDNELLVTAYGETEGFDQGSNTVVTLCEQSQVVAVYVSCCDDTNRMDGDNYKRSTFTGVLLRIV